MSIFPANVTRANEIVVLEGNKFESLPLPDVNPKIELFIVSPGHPAFVPGKLCWGVRAKEHLKFDEIIGYYAGLFRPLEKFNDYSYVLALGEEFAIDATGISNELRFINDARGTGHQNNCDMVTTPFYPNPALKEFYTYPIVVITREGIKAGEELFWDYGDVYWSVAKSQNDAFNALVNESYSFTIPPFEEQVTWRDRLQDFKLWPLSSEQFSIGNVYCGQDRQEDSYQIVDKMTGAACYINANIAKSLYPTGLVNRVLLQSSSFEVHVPAAPITPPRSTVSREFASRGIANKRTRRPTERVREALEEPDEKEEPKRKPPRKSLNQTGGKRARKAPTKIRKIAGKSGHNAFNCFMRSQRGKNLTTRDIAVKWKQLPAENQKIYYDEAQRLRARSK